jgi:PIN domain nuclease of toxin-antitoxin system
VSDAASVLDASALLAFMFDEPGAAIVEQALADGAFISAVNWAEVLTEIGRPVHDDAQRLMRLLGDALTIHPLTAEDGPAIAALRSITRSIGLSLGDRACLALAHRLGLPALTTDRSWTQLATSIDVGIRLARP